MNNLKLIVLLIILFSCATKDQESIPFFTEIRVKSFSKKIVQIEAISRKDVHCRSKSNDGKITDSCISTDGNVLFKNRQDARHYARSKAEFYCGNKAARVISGTKSREVSGKAPLKCEDRFGLYPYPNLGFSEIECLGGEDIYSQVITIEFECIN